MSAIVLATELDGTEGDRDITAQALSCANDNAPLASWQLRADATAKDVRAGIGWRH